MNLIGLFESKHELLFLFDNLLRGHHTLIVPLFGHRYLKWVRLTYHDIRFFRKIWCLFLSCDRHPPSFGFSPLRLSLCDSRLRWESFLQIYAELVIDRLYWELPLLWAASRCYLTYSLWRLINLRQSQWTGALLFFLPFEWWWWLISPEIKGCSKLRFPHFLLLFIEVVLERALLIRGIANRSCFIACSINDVDKFHVGLRLHENITSN